MEISTEGQIFIFLLAIFVGVILAGIYDFAKILRITMNFNKIRVFILDIIYFLISSVITFLFMIIFTYGEIRFYILFGEIVGFFLYRLAIGDFIVNIIFKIIKFVKTKIFPIFIFFKKIIFETINFLLKPFAILIKFFKKNLLNFKEVLYNLYGWLCKKVKLDFKRKTK